VAKYTGLARKRVAKAAGVARLEEETATAVAGAGLTLDQAAAVAVYADDADTTAVLIVAAEEGPGQFAHALTRAKQARAEAERAATLLGELTDAGRTVLDEDTGRARTRLADLEHDGRPLTAEGHAGRPGSAVYVCTHRLAGATGGRGVHRPGRQRHRGRWSATPCPPTQEARKPARPNGRPPRPSGGPPSRTTRRWRRRTRPAGNGSRPAAAHL
jgi:ParB family chromosome partitioning protein